MKPLSSKEHEILKLIALGYEDKDIGIKLKIAYGTVRNHVNKIVLKLQARNRTNAVVLYSLKNPDFLNEIKCIYSHNALF